MFSHLLDVVLEDVELSLPYDSAASATSVNVGVKVQSTEYVIVEECNVDISFDFDSDFIMAFRKLHHVHAHDQSMPLAQFMGLLLKSKAKFPIVAAQMFAVLGQWF